MKNIKTLLVAFIILISIVTSSEARENLGQSHFKERSVDAVLSGCTQALTQTALDLNNVRTTILTAGDMWWDLISAKYEIPKGGGASSIFSGSLWIGGIDAGNQLKVAAMTYRQNGVDFWPGPLDTASVNIAQDVCNQYDKHFTITRKEVEDFINAGTTTPGILAWPGNGTGAQGKHLAPYVDKDGNGIYNPDGGDYPAYSTDAHPIDCNTRQIFGDKTLWWVFNDEGNIHTETHGTAIGLEIRAQAFAFTSTDEINNMTFYDYEVINRSTIKLNKTYFGQWVDADLGYYNDDYVGCDVKDGVGYCYNGASSDGSGALGTYGANPPCVGVDFFRGPKIDTTASGVNDGKDSYGTSFVDPATKRINMAKFVYYNNDFTVTGNPTKAQDYYNYLSGFWIDGTPFTYGGTAKNGSTVCDFMFPGVSDPTGKGTNNIPQANWDEASSGNQPGDRRFMQSAGPFTLQPGAVNNVTVGVVWARASQGGNLASIPLMLDADVKAQALFNSCFRIMNGPDAPDLTVQELENQLIIYMTNAKGSNNYKEAYSEKDAYITTLPSNMYKFQGYQVYQIIDSSVTVTDVSNPDKARLVFQSDIQDGVKQIINYYKNSALGGVWVPQQMVYGADSGITRSFTVLNDAFTNARLVNQKQYHFMAIAYGYNAGEVSADPNNRLDGFNLPYIASRRNIKAYLGIPHTPMPEAGGTQVNSSYGQGIVLTRMEGQGNGGHILELTDQSVASILSSPLGNYADPQDLTSGGRLANVSYKPGFGPVSVKVIDPLNIPGNNYTIRISDTTNNARWVLTNLTTGTKTYSDTVLKISGDQVIPELGIAIKASYANDIGYSTAPGCNGILDYSMTFTDNTKQWLTALPDGEAADAASGGDQNWIRSGKVNNTTAAQIPFNDYLTMDDQQCYEKILGGTWAPYRMCAYTDGANICQGGPAFDKFNTQNYMQFNLSSVDVVITADKSKWTRCPVIELQENTAFAVGNARKMDMRKSASVDKYGRPGDGVSVSTNPDDAGYIAATGMGWFPGYAINIETGERLNMAFGEDSGLPGYNGRDMVWNPTADYYGGSYEAPIFGGKHYIYVFAHAADQKFPASDTYLPNGPRNIPRYDGGSVMWKLLSTETAHPTAANKYKKAVYSDAMWVNIPLMSSDPDRKLLETDVKVRIRVSRKYRRGLSAVFGSIAPSTNPNSVPYPIVLDTLSAPQNKNYPMYSFTTNDLQVQKGQGVVAKNALDRINIVPNPYYAYSGYETSQTDNRVKITNIPQTCKIRIYTINGTLVRTFNKDDPNTYLDWDIKNQSNIPVASGLYIIHVDVPGVGEKILKWFGVIRPIDLDSY